MPILILMILVISAYYLNNYLRTNSIILYILALFFSALGMIFPHSLYLELINNGTVGGLFLLIVMFTGAIGHSSKLKQALTGVRNIYAILGFILITPHVYHNFVETLLSGTELRIIALSAFFLMIPLFITSFKLVRQQMATSSWIQLHRLAYIVYLLLFIHLIRVSNPENIIGYYVVFGLYFFIRLYHHFEKYKVLKATTIIFVTGSISLLLINDPQNYFSNPYDIIGANSFEDGTYIGYAKGYQNNDTVVRVHIESNQIAYIIIDECGCTPYIKNDEYGKAAYSIAFSIKQENRTDIDALTGATITSNAINRAVINALESARK